MSRMPVALGRYLAVCLWATAAAFSGAPCAYAQIANPSVQLRFDDEIYTQSGALVDFRVEVDRNVMSQLANDTARFHFELVPKFSPDAELDSLTGEFRWRPQARDEGRRYDYTVRLVQEGRVLAQRAGRIVVDDAVPAPTLQLPENLLLEANTRNNPIPLEVSDPAGRPLRIRVTSSLPNAVRYDADSRQVIFPIQTENRYTVTVEVGNGVKTVRKEMNVTVARSNVQRPPVFYSEADNVVVSERERITIDVGAFDPNNDPIFYSIQNPQDLQGQARIPDYRSGRVEWTAKTLNDKDEETFVMQVEADDNISPNPPVKKVSITVRRTIPYAEQNKRVNDYLREFQKLEALETEARDVFTCLLKKERRQRLTRKILGGLTVVGSAISGIVLLQSDPDRETIRSLGIATAITGGLTGLQGLLAPDNLNSDIDALNGLNREILQFRSEEQVNNRDNISQISRTEDYFRVYKNLVIRNMVFEGRLAPVKQRLGRRRCK